MPSYFRPLGFPSPLPEWPKGTAGVMLTQMCFLVLSLPIVERVKLREEWSQTSFPEANAKRGFGRKKCQPLTWDDGMAACMHVFAAVSKKEDSQIGRH